MAHDILFAVGLCSIATGDVVLNSESVLDGQKTDGVFGIFGSRMRSAVLVAAARTTSGVRSLKLFKQ